MSMMREIRPAKCFLIFIFSLIIVTVLCGDTFTSFFDMKIRETPFITQMTGVSDLQCAYSCFATGSCCVVGYIESIKTCVRDNSFNCCPPNETSIEWTVLLRSTFGKYYYLTNINVAYNICAMHHDLAINIAKIDVKHQSITRSYAMVCLKYCYDWS